MTFWWWHTFTWFKDSSSSLHFKVLSFYDYAIFFIFTIGLLVGGLILFVLNAPSCNRFLCKKNEFEFIWTVAPIIILLLIAFPSIQLLYERSEVKNPLLTINATGYQWFWGYEYSDNSIIEFDSYIINDDCLVFSEFRNLEVDNRVVIPINTDVRLLTTGADVIHSWAVPSLGVNIDSVPGRINGIPLFSSRPAVYYGQCSEICGAYHAFMPIVVETVPVEVFEGWVYNHINSE